MSVLVNKQLLLELKFHDVEQLLEARVISRKLNIQVRVNYSYRSLEN